MVKYCSDSYQRDTKANTCQSDWVNNPTSQANPNLLNRTNWKDLGKIVGNSKNTYAYAPYQKVTKVTHYTETKVKGKDGKQVTKKVADKWKTTSYKPYELSLSKFNLDVPSNAHIYQVKFIIRMKVDKNVNVLQPAGNFRIGGKAGNRSELAEGTKTGWSKGSYVVVPTKKLTNKFVNVEYVMDEATFKQGGYTASMLNGIGMGIDLLPRDATFTGDNATGNFYVETALCVVEYDIPKPKVKITNPVAESYKTFNYTVDFDGTKNSPYRVAGDSDFPLKVIYKNYSKAYESNRKVKVDIPWGTELVSYSAEVGSFNTSTHEWSLTDKDYASYTLELMLKSSKNGLSNLNAHTTDDKTLDNYYYYVNPIDGVDFNSITMSPYFNVDLGLKKFYKREYCCIDLEIGGTSMDSTLGITIASSGVSIDNQTFTLVEKSDGVSLTSQTTTTANLTVPVGEEYSLTLRYCFLPLATGNLTLTVTNTDNSKVVTGSYEILDSLIYQLDLSGEEHELDFNVHRITSTIGTTSAIIPCISDEGDRHMIMTDCQINMSLWEQLDYIGCIPLEHTHFDPKSTYKDKLLDSHYKNKRYMGKQLATDEDIDLNVRLHPQQVTTLQGLISMDKPIPINANHKCFESDALNHRGWAEVYAVKTEYTNPHWYKCSIDVKYLTHNLNTRFKISNGEKVNDYKIPSLMTETHSSGTNLSSPNCYFDVDTDGTFYYASDYYTDDTPPVAVTFNDAERNSFTINNGQHIRITSHDVLSPSSIVSFNWSSVLIDEDDENSVSRIVRLIDKNKKTVFEYQYDDLVVGVDEVTSSVIYRVLNSNGVLDDFPIGKDMTFRYNSSDVTLEDDTVDVDTDTTFNDSEDDTIVDTEVEVEEDGEAHFGTTFRLSINNGTLSFVDEGFNGREISIDDIKLIDGEYYYQVEWINNNEDYETPSVETVFDFAVEDTILTTTYSQSFGDMIVSPFPVADKKILFTREAEEGTIYYYKDDKEEFSYLIEPYYQYHNGTDLVTSEGVSIFNLDYGYKIVYIQNGLVRLGFNRLTGEMYLGKYDPKLDDYITVYDLHLEKFDDINVNAISDDKIEIQASDSVFTIYRGHPYIKIKHELEDIVIDTISNRVWGEQVGASDGLDAPAYWDLMNDKNLLDACVGGGQGIKSSCVTTDEPLIVDRNASSLSWSSFPSDIQINTDTTFTLTGTAFTEIVSEVKFDDNHCDFGDYTFDVISDNAPYRFVNLTGDKNPIQTGETCNLVTELVDIDNQDVQTPTDVYFIQKFTPLSINLTSTNPIIQSGEKSNIQAKIVESDGQIMDNYRVDFYEIYTPTLTLGCLNPIIQTGEKANLQAKLKDEDGSLVKGVRIDFYEEYTPTSIRLTADKSIIQTSDVADLTATLKDSDGSLISGETIYFFEKIEE